MNERTTNQESKIANVQSDGDSFQSIPKEIQRRLLIWRVNYVISNTAHYIVGIIGILCSSLAATSFMEESFLPNIAGVISAVCFGILGFARPKENYLKYVMAWRVLEETSLNYRYGKATIEDLVKAVKFGNNLLTAYEDSDAQTQSKPSTHQQ